MNTISKISANGVRFYFDTGATAEKLAKPIITLPYIPTTSTTSYEGYTFEIGDIVRVKTNDFDGYYILKNLSGGNATWEQIENAPVVNPPTPIDPVEPDDPEPETPETPNDITSDNMLSQEDVNNIAANSTISITLHSNQEDFFVDYQPTDDLVVTYLNVENTPTTTYELTYSQDDDTLSCAFDVPQGIWYKVTAPAISNTTAPMEWIRFSGDANFDTEVAVDGEDNDTWVVSGNAYREMVWSDYDFLYYMSLKVNITSNIDCTATITDVNNVSYSLSLADNVTGYELIPADNFSVTFSDETGYITPDDISVDHGSFGYDTSYDIAVTYQSESGQEQHDDPTGDGYGVYIITGTQNNPEIKQVSDYNSNTDSCIGFALFTQYYDTNNNGSALVILPKNPYWDMKYESQGDVGLTYDEAVSYCESVTYAGVSTRLPSKQDFEQIAANLSDLKEAFEKVYGENGYEPEVKESINGFWWTSSRDTSWDVEYYFAYKIYDDLLFSPFYESKLATEASDSGVLPVISFTNFKNKLNNNG